MATASACSQSRTTTRNGNRSRQTSGRLRPVAMPSLALIDWTSIAIRFAASTTQSSVYPNSGAARHVGREVPGIDVGDGRDERGAQERQDRPDPASFTGKRGALGRRDNAGFPRQGVGSQHHLPGIRESASANGRAEPQ